MQQTDPPQLGTESAESTPPEVTEKTIVSIATLGLAL